MMPCRYETLKQVLAGYERSGIELISCHDSVLLPSDASDDVGMYYFIPKIVRWFNISLDSAIHFFFYGMVLCAFVLGVVGFFLLSKSWLFRIIAVVWLALFSFFSCYHLTDIYLVPSSLAIGTIPLLLYFIKQQKTSLFFNIFIFLSGLAIGYAHYLRSYSSLAALFFFMVGIGVSLSISWKKRVGLFLFLIMGLSISVLHFRSVFKQQQHFFGKTADQFLKRHVFWHSVYAGFGFLNNDFGIAWDDKTVIDKVGTVDAHAVYPTKEYESVAKSLVFDLIKKHPHFVLQTLFAKLGVIFYYFLLFANVGLFVAWFYRKKWIMECAFFGALSVSSLFGFLAIPGSYYLMGFLAFAVLYGIVSLEYALRSKKT